MNGITRREKKSTVDDDDVDEYPNCYGNMMKVRTASRIWYSVLSSIYSWHWVWVMCTLTHVSDNKWILLGLINPQYKLNISFCNGKMCALHTHTHKEHFCNTDQLVCGSIIFIFPSCKEWLKVVKWWWHLRALII